MGSKELKEKSRKFIESGAMNKYLDNYDRLFIKRFGLLEGMQFFGMKNMAWR
jgi:hypothetical protein